jgi:hypothetical protein
MCFLYCAIISSLSGTASISNETGPPLDSKMVFKISYAPYSENALEHLKLNSDPNPYWTNSCLKTRKTRIIFDI